MIIALCKQERSHIMSGVLIGAKITPPHTHLQKERALLLHLRIHATVSARAIRQEQRRGERLVTGKPGNGRNLVRDGRWGPGLVRSPFPVSVRG